jgi:hypothetical protein
MVLHKTSVIIYIESLYLAPYFLSVMLQELHTFITIFLRYNSWMILCFFQTFAFAGIKARDGSH